MIAWEKTCVQFLSQSSAPSRTAQQDSSPFLGMISRCFEPHLNVYIESQDR